MSYPATIGTVFNGGRNSHEAITGRKVCLGYLMPILAHSFCEVRQAAVQIGDLAVKKS